MLILPTKPSAATSQSGYSLPELMVAVGLGGIVSLMIVSFLAGIGKIQQNITLKAELESIRSQTLLKVDCTASCAGLIPGKKTIGSWSVDTECHSIYSDANVSVTHKKINEASGPLFTLDNWVCKARRPKQCIDACHNSGEMLDRGYLFPKLEHPHANSYDFRCPTGQIVGVDFSTNRIVCERHSPLPTGPMCKQDVNIAVRPDDVHQVAISGPKPCIEHTQDQARFVLLAGGSLKVNLDDSYKPKDGERFVIIIAEKVTGKFSNKDDKIYAGAYEYSIKYTATSVSIIAKKLPPAGRRAEK